MYNLRIAGREASIRPSLITSKHCLDQQRSQLRDQPSDDIAWINFCLIESSMIVGRPAG